MPTVDIISPAGAFSPAAVGDGATDDAPAFRAFNVWAQAQVSPITLTLGTGAKTFLFGSADSNNQRSNSPVFNVTQPLTVVGNGSSTSILKSSAAAAFTLGGQSSMKSGNGNFGSSSIFTARLNSVLAGSSAVTCKTVADAALFSVNSWALISGLDTMGAFSTPPNPFWFEYVFITNVNTGTGVITFQSALENTYLDSWPVFDAGTPGLQPDRAGPATLYVLDPQWNIDVTYQSLGIDRTADGNNLTYASGRNVNFINVKIIGSGGITPTLNGTMTFTSCDLTSYSMEFDKLVGRAVFDATATGQLHFQSSDKDVVIQNGCAVSSFNGTPRNLTINNSTVGNFSLGATSFGKTDSFVTSGSTFNSSFTFGGVVDSGDNTGVLQTDYTMANGVIRVQKSGLAYGCRWAIPGAYCFFTGTSIAHGPMFKVLRVADGGSFFDVFTNWQAGGFPSWATAIQAVPSFSENFAPNTISSTPDVVNLIAATAAGRPHSRTYTSVQRNGGNLGNFGTGNAATLPSVSGRLISLTVNVVTPYTGAQSSLLWHLAGQFDNLPVVKSDLTTTTYGPIIDLKVGGTTRIITPSGVTGSGGLDSGLALPTPTSWLVELIANVCASQDVVSEYNANNAVGPVVTITAITDQGFVPDVVTPLRLRLYS